jgi:hypothetical protein
VDVTAHVNNESEEDIAINPTNPNQLVVESNQDTTAAGMFFATSSDAGATWTGRIIGDGTDFPGACCDPSLSWDHFGNLFVSYIDSVGTNFGTLLLSTDGGQTFTQIAQYVCADQPKVTTNANTVWVVFNSLNGDIQAFGAPVFGLGQVGTFSAPEAVPNSAPGNFGNIAIGPAGQVMVSYQDPTSGIGPDSIHVAVDPDGLGPLGFSNPKVATATNVGGFRPISAQPNRTIDADGRVYYATSGKNAGRAFLDYTDGPDTTSDEVNIFVRFSDDDGASWSSPVRVNDDGAGHSHFWPHMAVDPVSGNPVISWYDTRNDPTNAETEFFLSYSVDGGQTFAPNVQVSGGPSNVTGNPPLANNGFDYGDFTGIAAFGCTVYPAWADDSNSTGNNPDGHWKAMDVLTAKVTLTGFASLPDDQFEFNETSDTAAQMGLLTGTHTFAGLTLNIHANGLPDYDWYRWTSSGFGTLTVSITNVQTMCSDVLLRVYQRQSDGTLTQIASSLILTGGANNQIATALVSGGEDIYVNVSSFNHALARYDMTVSLT